MHCIFWSISVRSGPILMYKICCSIVSVRFHIYMNDIRSGLDSNYNHFSSVWFFKYNQVGTSWSRLGGCGLFKIHWLMILNFKDIIRIDNTYTYCHENQYFTLAPSCCALRKNDGSCLRSTEAREPPKIIIYKIIRFLF